MTIPSVLIIGAGPSGLVAAKEAKQCGFNPTVLEKDNTIGGLWKPDGKPWKGMLINNSRHASSFSDHEWPKGAPDFPSRDDVYDYLQSYTKTFNLMEYIHINCAVEKIEQTNNKWLVKWVKKSDEKEQRVSAIFDFVIVSSGFFSEAFIPQITGSETFTGSIIHSKDYKSSNEPSSLFGRIRSYPSKIYALFQDYLLRKLQNQKTSKLNKIFTWIASKRFIQSDPSSFKGKTIVVIGSAFSACEIAATVAKVAKKVFNIFRRPNWITSRYLKGKDGEDNERFLPFDWTWKRSLVQSTISNEPSLPTFDRYKKINQRLHSMCNMQEKINPDLAVPVPSSDPPLTSVSDAYLPLVKKGTIIPKKCVVTKIDKDFLFLSDGNIIKGVDKIIFCTGYRTRIPFFSESIQKQLDFHPEDPLQPLPLYKTVFHPEFQNLAFVGMSRFNIFFGPIELQARLATMTFSGKIPYPSKTLMEEGIHKEKKIREMNPRPQFANLEYINFCDDLAKGIGALPDLGTLKKERPDLYKKLWNGPFTTASYRLTGFGANPTIAMKKINELYQNVGESPFLNPECIYSSLH
ncbi:MAG: NAD(P)-binding domain-containing protein [Parachlamydiaceae bacterium]